MARRDPAKPFIDAITRLDRCVRLMDFPPGPNDEATARIRLLGLCAHIAVSHGFAVISPEAEKLGLAIGGRRVEAMTYGQARTSLYGRSQVQAVSIA
jgi:hypothetical protein